ncbi:MAG: response regulator [Bacteriovoracia bacterium]
MAANKLLVADDSLTIQKVIRLALSSEGYEIEAVSNGKEALEQIPLFRPDVVLIDSSLPDKNAFEIRREFKDNPDFSHIRFIVMASAYEQLDEAQVNALQFHGRLIKPFDPGHLRKILSDVLKNAPAPTGPTGKPASVEKEVTQILNAGAVPPSAPKPPPHPPRMPPGRPGAGAASAAPPSKPKSNDIWDQDAFHEVPQDGGGGGGGGEEEDIRQLTESTIKLAGMDNFQWSVNEPGSRPSASPFAEAAPPAAPPAAPAAAANSPDVVGDKTYTDMQVDEPFLKPSKNILDTEEVTFDLDQSSLEEKGIAHDGKAEKSGGIVEVDFSDSPAAPAGASDKNQVFFGYEPGPTDSDFTPPAQPPRHPPNFSSGAAQIQVEEEQTDTLRLHRPTHQQLEDAVAKQLQATLEKTIERLLPEIAEKVIRQEIHRLLSEPPPN